MPSLDELEHRIAAIEREQRDIYRWLMTVCGRARAVEIGLRCLLDLIRIAQPREWRLLADAMRGHLNTLDDETGNPAGQILNGEIRRILEEIISSQEPSPPKPPEFRIIVGGKDQA